MVVAPEIMLPILPEVLEGDQEATYYVMDSGSAANTNGVFGAFVAGFFGKGFFDEGFFNR